MRNHMDLNMLEERNAFPRANEDLGRMKKRGE